jgi:hypothetical protein
MPIVASIAATRETVGDMHKPMGWPGRTRVRRSRAIASVRRQSSAYETDSVASDTAAESGDVMAC